MGQKQLFMPEIASTLKQRNKQMTGSLMCGRLQASTEMVAGPPCWSGMIWLAGHYGRCGEESRRDRRCCVVLINSSVVFSCCRLVEQRSAVKGSCDHTCLIVFPP